jgi:thiol:disulfide interchange protein DsbD
MHENTSLIAAGPRRPQHRRTHWPARWSPRAPTATLPRLLPILLAALMLLPAAASAEDDFLQPDQAFRISGTAAGPEAVVVRWNIEPGYYLYRSKFRFRSESPGIALGHPDLPAAETKHDEFFGDVEIYRDHVEARVPVERGANAGNMVAIEAKSQGCADAGLCYPPQQQRILLELPKLAAVDTDATQTGAAAVQPEPAEPAEPSPPQSMAQALAGGSGKGGGVAQSLGLGMEDDILPAEEAFRFSAEVAAPDRLQLTWDIAPGTYMYQEKIELALQDAEGVQLGEYELPEAEIKHDTVRPDGSIGDEAIYHGTVNLDLPLERGSAEPTDVTLVAKFQGCAERGICYPPVTERVPLALPAASATVALAQAAPAEENASTSGGGSGGSGDDSASASAGGGSQAAPAGRRISEQDQIAARLAETGIFGAMAIFFGLGLLLAFTPCVFPMIPILSGIIAGQGETITTRKAFFLSLAYVLAMALTYAVVGVIAGLFGANLQATFQNPWLLGAFAAVFVALALSMFGFYDLQLPSSWQSKLTEISNKQEGGTLAGAAIMGALSALIVGPCVAPPLMGALIFIGQTGDAVLGFFALLGLGLGMGAPLLVIGTSAGKLLPRAGAWMDAVKAVFGVLLLAVAILLLERVLPAAASMVLWALLLIASGVYMGALTTLTPASRGWTKLWKALGLALLVYGVLMLVGAAAGGKDTIQPLRGLVPAGGGGATAAQAEFRRIKTVDDLDQALASASAAGKPVMLDFYADWCVSCKEMERYTFPDPNVIAAMNKFVLLQADVTANDAEDKALMQERFGIPGPPAMLFFDPSGTELRGYRLVGFVPANDFAAHLNEVAP